MSRTAVVVGALLVVGLAACGDAAAPSADSTATVSSPAPTTTTAGPNEVVIGLQSFEPASLTVAKGTEVTWRSQYAIAHTVTSGTYVVDPRTDLRTSQKPDGKFDLAIGQIGQTVSTRFDAPGTYPYYCTIHQGMNATVVVTP